MIDKEHQYVRLARETIEAYVKEGKVRIPPRPLPPEYDRRAGVFVSIKKDKKLRGCIGTIEPIKENLAQEIIINAISAASRDPRFLPVTSDELDKLEISVDVLGEAEEVDSIKELDPVEYGVIVEKGSRRGLLLPNLEGVDTAEEQVEIARMKAGLPPEVQFTLYRFKVNRYK